MFTGYGDTIEQALTAAADEALKSWRPAGPDDMARVEFKSLTALYGGIVGHVGTRVVVVDLVGNRQGAGLAAAGVAAPQPELSLKLEVLPDEVWVNLMPPVTRPQSRKVAFQLTVSNTGTADFQGQSPDSAIVRFSVLKGRTTIWNFPEFAGQVVTPITIRPGESRTFGTTWEIGRRNAGPQPFPTSPDAVDYVDADLHAVALFVPTRASALAKIQVKAAF